MTSEKHTTADKPKANAYLILIPVFILLMTGILMLSIHFIKTEKQDAASRSSTSETRADRSLADDKILCLYSYDTAFESFEADKQGIQRVLDPLDVDYDIMCMDAREFNTDRDIQAFHDMLKERLAGGDVRYTGVIVSDDMALRFVLRYKNELFRSLPVTYFGINDAAIAQDASMNPLISGYVENDCIKETISLAKKLMPNAKKVVDIYDNSPSGYGTFKACQSVAADFPGLSFGTYNFSDYTRSETEAYLKSLSQDTIVLFSNASRDADNNYYSIDSAAELLSRYCPVPVFRSFIGGFTSGVTCGVYENFEETSELAARNMVAALKGRTDFAAQNKPLTASDQVIYACNYNRMKQYGLDTGVLPGDAQISDLPADYWTTYHQILIPASLILTGLLLLVFFLRHQYFEISRKEKDLEDAMGELKKSREDLRWSAEHDYLTGLLNWRTAEGRLNEFSEKNIDQYAMILIDVDNFKTINETYGHKSGDFVLKTLTERLQKLSEKYGMFLSRYGGDEFLILVKGKYLTENSDELTDIAKVFREPVRVCEDQLVPFSSIGVANSGGGQNIENVILNADIAVNHAKQKGKALICFYSEEMKQEVSTESEAKAAIIDASENDGFYMVYQPQIDTARGKITGYESLVRMKNAKISPGVFIPIAESSGWIRKIGRITTEKVIRQIADWRDAGMEMHPVSINFSFGQLSDRQYVKYLKSLLEKYDVPASLVEIEITERITMDNSRRTKDLLDEFTEMGISLHMDDFGTGYSSLGVLKYIPVSHIKIDKSLVDNYLTKDDDSFINDVIRMAHDLGKSVIVEGVETESQYRRLREFKADTIQGYYFSKPLATDDIPAFRAVLPEDLQAEDDAGETADAFETAADA